MGMEDEASATLIFPVVLALPNPGLGYHCDIPGTSGFGGDIVWGSVSAMGLASWGAQVPGWRRGWFVVWGLSAGL